MIDNPREYEIMARVEADHWWYRSLHSRVESSLASHFKRRDISILDAGCGTGGLMKFLGLHGYTDISGFDLSDVAVHFCVKQGLAASIGDLGHISNIQPGRLFDCIISNDNLYHLAPEQRVHFLSDASARLLPNGILILNLPAFRSLRGSHDKAVGISHRFNKQEIKAMATQAGLAIVKMDYWPFMLSAPIWLVRTWQRLLDHKRPRIASPTSDLRTYPAALNGFLRNVITLERKLLPAAPFGSSLFVVLAAS